MFNVTGAAAEESRTQAVRERPGAVVLRMRKAFLRSVNFAESAKKTSRYCATQVTLSKLKVALSTKI